MVSYVVNEDALPGAYPWVVFNPETRSLSHIVAGFMIRKDAQAFADKKNAEVPRYAPVGKDIVWLTGDGGARMVFEQSTDSPRHTLYLTDALQTICDLLNEKFPPPEVERADGQ
tara:strand:- start:242 stop:583 length:342 start_codon:yes stop_codon:yes gene_type:complete